MSSMCPLLSHSKRLRFDPQLPALELHRIRLCFPVDVYQIGCDDAIACDISAYWMNTMPTFPLLQVARWVLFIALKI